MKLTITNDIEEESEEVILVPKGLYNEIVKISHDRWVFPTPRRTTTIGAEPDACPLCEDGRIKFTQGNRDIDCPECGGTGQA